MKTMTYILFAASALVSASCISLQTPEKYAERTETGRYDYLAISTDASAISVTVRRNEDKKKGTLAYWTEASRNHLTLSRGYEFLKEGEFTSEEGAGRWMLFAKKYRGVDFLYLLGLVVDGRDIYVLEAGGEKEPFEPDVPRIVKAFETLD